MAATTPGSGRAEPGLDPMLSRSRVDEMHPRIEAAFRRHAGLLSRCGSLHEDAIPRIISSQALANTRVANTRIGPDFMETSFARRPTSTAIPATPMFLAA